VFHIRTQKNADVQSIKAIHSQELSDLQKLLYETQETLKSKYENQIEQIKSMLTSTQNEYYQKKMEFEQQIHGKSC
jgi:hypothetical protein